MTDVPGEKIWIELKLILRGRFAGHLMRVILQQQLASQLGAPRFFLLLNLNLFSSTKVYLNRRSTCSNWKIVG